MPRLPLEKDGKSTAYPPGTPNPEIMKKDPMAEMFGPASGVKLIGEPEDQIPDEVRAILEQFNLSTKTFHCVLKEIPEGSNFGDSTSSSSNSEYIRGWTRSIPSVDWIAKNHGPGMYVLMFSWHTREQDPDTDKYTQKTYHQEIPISISQKAAGDYKKHRLDRKLREASEIGTQVQEALMEKKLETAALKGVLGDKVGEDITPAVAAKQYIAETIEAAKMIGLSPLASQPVKTIEWEKILPALVTGVTAFIQMQQNTENARREDFNKLLMLMMSNSQQASGHLIEVMKAQTGVGSGNMAIKEFKDMVLGALDIKEALNGNKETLADKIFRVVEGVAPMIITVAANAAEARAAQNTMPVKLAKTYVNSNPDFQALKNNPVEMKKAIGKMDDFFGWSQTDTIMEVMGWPRPPDCPRDPSKEHAPQLPAEGDIHSNDDPLGEATQ